MLLAQVNKATFHCWTTKLMQLGKTRPNVEWHSNYSYILKLISYCSRNTFRKHNTSQKYHSPNSNDVEPLVDNSIELVAKVSHHAQRRLVQEGKEFLVHVVGELVEVVLDLHCISWNTKELRFFSLSLDELTYVSLTVVN